MKRLGRFTFADALNARFQSRGIQLAAGVSTLAVSVFYLIPQMVGAGVLIQPLLGLPHWAGVLLVGATVIVIVVTAGMVSTTWVQFLKGALLVIFSAILTVMVLNRGFDVKDGGLDGYQFRTLGPVAGKFPQAASDVPELANYELLDTGGKLGFPPYLRTRNKETNEITTWLIDPQADGKALLRECQTLTQTSTGGVLVNGLPKGVGPGHASLRPIGFLSSLPDGKTSTGPIGPLKFFSTLQQSEVVLWHSQKFLSSEGVEPAEVTTIFSPHPTPGSQVLRPGESPTFKGIRSDKFTDKLNFLSLMLALFCGTASLPHILIRYYTVKDAAAARKSTIVGIACIGFFYVLTLYMGLGAMTSGSLDVSDSNMAAPLLARGLDENLFAVISAIAFTTVLGTVSGLILASAGAVSHDLISLFTHEKLTEHGQVRVAKIASVIVGCLAIVLGILFQSLNVSYLVGWAFSVAASANLPSLVMLLFWRGVTKQGVIAAVLVGMISSLAWILLSGDTFSAVYGLPAENALVPFSQPGIVTIPLGFLTLIVFSLLTKTKTAD
jgi:cation/acetate symporter